MNAHLVMLSEWFIADTYEWVPNIALPGRLKLGVSALKIGHWGLTSGSRFMPGQPPHTLEELCVN